MSALLQHSTTPPALAAVPCVSTALEARKPAAHWTAERGLFAALPDAVREDVRRLLGLDAGGGVFGAMARAIEAGATVQAAAQDAWRTFAVPGSWQRLRARYDLWSKAGDWVSLVNRARAGGAWVARSEGLPEAFLVFVAKRFGEFKRADGKRQAWFAILRQWATGRDSGGTLAEVPGYGFRKAGQPEVMPGWSYSNVMSQIKRRGKFTPAVRAMLHQGTAEARNFVPQVRFDRNTGGADGGPLRFLERVEFDDVRCDFLVIDPVSGQACDLWLLIARDLGTALVLGFGMRPAKSREDGKQDHLKLKDMRQLCGWILERFGLPPYASVWKIEHGTATLPAGTQAALRELLPGRIEVSYSSMIGGASAAGYQERGLGNSKGKASLESHNRLMHTMLADMPGQSGMVYAVRPMDLGARAKEAVKIWESAQLLPAHLRSEVGYPLLTVAQAREHIFRVFGLQNQRTEHKLQGFDSVGEWFDAAAGLWRVGGFPGGDVQVRQRRESPLERCARLSAPYLAEWSQVGPDVIRAFYEHTCRGCVVNARRLIEFRVEDRLLEFAPPESGRALVPGTRALGYSHPDDPAFLHLSDGQGRMLGTWLRRDRAGDRESLTRAIRYSQAALAAVKQTASELAADERARLDAMRAGNARLLAEEAACIEVAPVVGQRAAVVGSAVARALATNRGAVRQAEAAQEDLAEAARAALRAWGDDE